MKTACAICAGLALGGCGTAMVSPAASEPLREAARLWGEGQVTSALSRSAVFLAKGGGTASERAWAMRLLLRRPELALLSTVDPCHPARAAPPPELAFRWWLFCGRHALRVGTPQRARASLGRSRHALAYQLQALVALRAGHLDEAEGLLVRAQAAAGARPLHPLLRLQRARLAAEVGKIAAARGHYRAVPAWSPFFGRARQELAWLELRARRPRTVLAQIAIHDRLGAEGAAFPERRLLVALALADLCDPRARRLAQLAARRLQRQIEKLAFFLRRRADPRLYYVEALASLAGRNTAFPPSLHGALIADPSFTRAFALVRQIARERAALQPVGATGRALAGEVRGRLIRAQTLAGATVRRLLGGVLGELRGLRHRADALLVELDHRSETEAPHKSSVASNRAGPGFEGRQRAWRKDWAVWPIGSLWPSEIEAIDVDLSSRCSRSSSAASRPASSPTPSRSSR